MKETYRRRAGPKTKGILSSPPFLHHHTLFLEAMEHRPGLIIRDGALYHGHSALGSADPDEEMSGQGVLDEDYEEGDEDDAMTPKYYSFDEASGTETATPGPTPGSTPGSMPAGAPEYHQRNAGDEAGFEDDVMEQVYTEMVPSSSSTRSRHGPSDRSETPAKKSRIQSGSVAPGYERGSSKRRSGQTRYANQQLLSTLSVRDEQHQHDLAAVRNQVSAELREEYSRHVAMVKEEAVKKEQMYLREWVSCFCTMFNLTGADGCFV